jgi:Asp-tRNA(Asn)/Glu-tRNA(Gln) amidotransferase A subunit family amidase
MVALHELTASEALMRLGSGKITVEELLRACLERIAARDPDVAAWAFLDRDHAVAVARALDRAGDRGPMHGIPVGFKDIINTADLPTSYGSPVYYGHRPASDAACVVQTRLAGGFVLGKTVSTEFAFRYPGPTANPHDRRHSPGGSSSGSAAAVADCQVPLAVGTQTAGSVIRPAAYCGVYGMKPTFGALSFSGVRHLAESFDTLGCMARSLADIALFRAVLQGIRPMPLASDPPTPRLGFCRTAFWEEAETAARALLESTVERLANAGAQVTDFTVGDDRALLDATWVINKFEGARTLAYDRAQHPESVSAAVRDLVDEGRSIPLDAYLDAVRLIATSRERLHDALGSLDALITPSAAGEAPKGLNDTGPVMFNYLWTVLHTPALTLPAGRGPNGLPLGIQLVGRRHDDERLLAVASWVDLYLK